MRLQAAREKSGKTQAQVAKEAAVSETMYQRYEYGRNEPGVRTAIRIADALGVVDLRKLFCGSNRKVTTHDAMIPQRGPKSNKK